MRQAIISDIHGNLQALQQVLQRIEVESCDRTICLGDVVGYGPFPDECCELLFSRCRVTLLGNHDHALLGLTDPHDFNEYARQALLIQSALMQAATLDKLSQCPLTFQQAEAFYVHAAPAFPSSWRYLTGPYDLINQWDAFAQRVCFIGHTHRPLAFHLTGRRTTVVQPENDLTLQPDGRYIINVGSVGQPRDGQAEACFVIQDVEEQRVQWIRVPYDVQATQDAMRQRHLPNYLIRRLTFGH